MRVCICTKWKDYDCSKTGKGFFAERLSRELEKLGVEIVPPDAPADIDLAIGRQHYTPNARAELLRLGPAHINIKTWHEKYNRRKKKSLKAVDGVVYQSEFSKKVCDKFIGKTNNPSTIIFNGASPSKVVHENGQKETIFLASTRDWLKQKRLKHIIASFLLADIPDSRLVVAGESKYGIGCSGWPNISFVGNVSQQELEKLYVKCSAMIHIVYLDACPNSVVEALVSGLPVICSNQGGTKELVAPVYPELVLPLDEEYRFGLVDLDHPPNINCVKLAEAMKKIPDKKPAPHLHIENIAKQYYDFFRRFV